MKALIEAELFRQMERDRRRVSRSRAVQAECDDLVIRRSYPEDKGSLHRLALLDSAPEPHGPMLVAEREGVVVAAVPLGSGRSIADPFVPTKDIVGLLELRRKQLRPAF